MTYAGAAEPPTSHAVIKIRQTGGAADAPFPLPASTRNLHVEEKSLLVLKEREEGRSFPPCSGAGRRPDMGVWVIWDLFFATRIQKNVRTEYKFASQGGPASSELQQAKSGL